MIICYKKLINKYEDERWAAAEKYGNTATANYIWQSYENKLKGLYKWSYVDSLLDKEQIRSTKK